MLLHSMHFGKFRFDIRNLHNILNQYDILLHIHWLTVVQSLCIRLSGAKENFLMDILVHHIL